MVCTHLSDSPFAALLYAEFCVVCSWAVCASRVGDQRGTTWSLGKRRVPTRNARPQSAGLIRSGKVVRSNRPAEEHPYGHRVLFVAASGKVPHTTSEPRSNIPECASQVQSKEQIYSPAI